MNILITGGTGFIGSALTARLAADGHRIAVVDNRATGVPWTADRAAAAPGSRASGSVVCLAADIAAPGGKLRALFDAERPEAVIHLAAQASVVDSLRDPVGGAAVNVGGTVNLLQHSLDSGVRRFIFASTGGALYGDSAPRPTPETFPPAPVSPYGASKAAAEQYVRAMSGLGGMRYTILRLGNVYGPGQAADGEPGVVSAFARAMLLQTRPVIYGDGFSQRDYVHVDDVVEAHRLALRILQDGVFNIATGTARTVRQVFDAVARAAGYRQPPAYAPARAGELRRCRLDVARAGGVLGWRARIPFERGVAGTVESMRARTPLDATAAVPQ